MNLKRNFAGLILAGISLCACSTTNNSKNLNLQDLPYSERIEFLENLSYREAIEHIDTIEEAEFYVRDYLTYELGGERYGKYVKPFERTHKDRYANCTAASLAVSELLKGDGFESKHVIMFPKNEGPGHSIFIYQNSEGMYGSLGIGELDCNPPIYESVNDLISRYLRYNRYALTELKEGAIPKWVDYGKSPIEVTNEVLEKGLEKETWYLVE